MELFSDLTGYHWLVFGLLLLGAGIAALMTGIVVFVAPGLAPGLQFVLFSIGAMLATYLYFQVFRSAQDEEDSPPINQRAAALVGYRFELEDALDDGDGRVQIGDTFWRVHSDQPIDAGVKVQVVGAANMSLVLAPAD